MFHDLFMLNYIFLRHKTAKKCKKECISILCMKCRYTSQVPAEMKNTIFTKFRCGFYMKQHETASFCMRQLETAEWSPLDKNQQRILNIEFI